MDIPNGQWYDARQPVRSQGMNKLQRKLWLADHAPDIKRRADLGDKVCLIIIESLAAEDQIWEDATGRFDIAIGLYADMLIKEAIEGDKTSGTPR